MSIVGVCVMWDPTSIPIGVCVCMGYVQDRVLPKLISRAEGVYHFGLDKGGPENPLRVNTTLRALHAPDL